VTLSDVTISHVDFTDATFYCLVLRNVTLTKLQFKKDIWRATQLENSLIDEHSLMLRRDTTQGHALPTLAASSKTTRFDIDHATPIDGLNHEVDHDGDWDWDIHLGFVPCDGDILTRLAKHKDIIDRIMRYCFPGSSVHIFEYPNSCMVPRKSVKSRKLYPRRNDTATTYFGSLQHGLLVILPGTALAAGSPTLGISTEPPSSCCAEVLCLSLLSSARVS
jgi:hypothetical protein